MRRKILGGLPRGMWVSQINHGSMLEGVCMQLGPGLPHSTRMHAWDPWGSVGVMAGEAKNTGGGGNSIEIS